MPAEGVVMVEVGQCSDMRLARRMQGTQHYVCCCTM
jgi:hypothetical protein